MSSLSESKKRLKSLRDRWVGVWQDIPRRPFVVSAVVLAALLLSVFTYRDWPTPWDWLQGGHDGQIIVNSPTVYTRQRLVNDRLQQATWLQEQLNDTGKNFRSVDQLSRRTSEEVGRVGVEAASKPRGGGDQTSAKADQTPAKADQASADPIRVESTTAAEFRAKNLFREEVRAEITQTQLDDRHDINGNTIYRLAFDATVVGGTRKNSVAAIRIALGHYPHGRKKETSVFSRLLSFVGWHSPAESESEAALRKLYKDDYERLYLDWIRYMQKNIPDSIENISNSIISGNIDRDPGLRLLLVRFLLENVCQLKVKLKTLTDKQIYCDPEQFSKETEGYDVAKYDEAIRNKNAALEFMEGDLEGYFEKTEILSSRGFLQRLVKILSRGDQNYKPPSKLDPDSLDRNGIEIQTYESARYTCKLLNAQQVVLQIDLSTLLPQGVLKNEENTQVGCPFYDSPAQRLVAGVLLYEELAALESRAEKTKEIPRDLAEKIKEQRDCTKRKLTGDQILCGYVNRQAAVRCFAAEFIRANLDFFGRAHNQDRPGIRSFVNMEVVGRESGDCNLQITERKSGRAEALENLTYLLNLDTEAFAYSVAPKNFTENISTASETRDTFEFLARYGFHGDKETSAFADDLRRRSSELRAVIARPIVVGFEAGRRELEMIHHPLDDGRSTPAIREIDFGWVIAPRFRDGVFEQIDNQYALTSVISVPSWWRSVELDIETCWQSREALSDLQRRSGDDVNICEGKEKQTHNTVIRLPGAIPELSRKLGFEVLQEPYLSRNGNQVLEIGEKGALLLRGARLWRSTEVTVGSQKADNIVVLPNMEGIIAEFKCVLPQLSDAGDDGNRIKTAAYVWTSEGVTTEAAVTLIWPRSDMMEIASKQVASNDVAQEGSNGRSKSDSAAQRDGEMRSKAKAKWCPVYEQNSSSRY
jgi:hypothetical protein